MSSSAAVSFSVNQVSVSANILIAVELMYSCKQAVLHISIAKS